MKELEGTNVPIKQFCWIVALVVGSFNESFGSVHLSFGMAFHFPQRNAVCGVKRKHAAESSSMFTKLDWVDHVVADVVATEPCHKTIEVERKMKVEPCLHEFFTTMLQSRGYPASTHSTLTCGYNNKPTVRQCCIQ